MIYSLFVSEPQAYVKAGKLKMNGEEQEQEIRTRHTFNLILYG